MSIDASQSLISLCKNVDRDPESALLQDMRLVFYIDPNAANGIADNGMTVLHCAVIYCRSVEFCKLLIERKPELVKTPDNDGMLPIHHTCSANHSSCRWSQRHQVKITKFLFGYFPELRASIFQIQMVGPQFTIISLRVMLMLQVGIL